MDVICRPERNQGAVPKPLLVVCFLIALQHRRDAFQKYQKCWEVDFQERAVLANQEEGGLFAAEKKQRGIPALAVLEALAEKESEEEKEGGDDDEEEAAGGVDAEAVEVAEEEEEEDDLSSESGELEVCTPLHVLCSLAKTTFY